MTLYPADEDERDYDWWALANADDPLSGGLDLPAEDFHEPPDEETEHAPLRIDD